MASEEVWNRLLLLLLLLLMATPPIPMVEGELIRVRCWLNSEVREAVLVLGDEDDIARLKSTWFIIDTQRLSADGGRPIDRMRMRLSIHVLILWEGLVSEPNAPQASSTQQQRKDTIVHHDGGKTWGLADRCLLHRFHGHTCQL